MVSSCDMQCSGYTIVSYTFIGHVTGSCDMQYACYCVLSPHCVFTGPCGGKTTGQSRLSTFFENLGWKVSFVSKSYHCFILFVLTCHLADCHRLIGMLICAV